jgi:hypothetical protein
VIEQAFHHVEVGADITVERLEVAEMRRLQRQRREAGELRVRGTLAAGAVSLHVVRHLAHHFELNCRAGANIANHAVLAVGVMGNFRQQAPRPPNGDAAVHFMEQARSCGRIAGIGARFQRIVYLRQRRAGWGQRSRSDAGFFMRQRLRLVSRASGFDRQVSDTWRRTRHRAVGSR